MVILLPYESQSLCFKVLAGARDKRRGKEQGMEEGGAGWRDGGVELVCEDGWGKSLVHWLNHSWVASKTIFGSPFPCVLVLSKNLSILPLYFQCWVEAEHWWWLTASCVLNELDNRLMGSKLFRDPQALSSTLATLGVPQPRAFRSLNNLDPSVCCLTIIYALTTYLKIVATRPNIFTIK